ncbi:hypothetical protein BpHYR1_041205, partial [Brachionus plicatilis]
LSVIYIKFGKNKKYLANSREKVSWKKLEEFFKVKNDKLVFQKQKEIDSGNIFDTEAEVVPNLI